MAAFKVGQRVRVVSCDQEPWAYLIGKEGVIDRALGYPFEWLVRINAPHIDPAPTWPGCFGFNSHELAPLLPPDEAADAFLARIKKLGSEPVNDAPKVTVREGK